MFSFGKGTHGRLGNGNDGNVYEPMLVKGLQGERVVAISAGCRHAGAVTESGSLYMWGFNFYEQLGIGLGDKDYDTPVLIEYFNESKVLAVSCGYFHSAVLAS